jgi:hypothetical protein
MRILSFSAAVCLAWAGLGCRGDKAPENTATPQFQDYSNTSPTNLAAGQKFIVTPVDGRNGRVSSVNQSLRFAVLTFPVGHLPNLNQHLSLYRHGLKVGEVNVTGPQRDDSIVADVVIGEAQAGDEVRTQ